MSSAIRSPPFEAGRMTRTLLSEMDNITTQLFELGYFNTEQAVFLGKYIYKYDEAMNVAHPNRASLVTQTRDFPGLNNSQNATQMASPTRRASNLIERDDFSVTATKENVDATSSIIPTTMSSDEKVHSFLLHCDQNNIRAAKGLKEPSTPGNKHAEMNDFNRQSAAGHCPGIIGKDAKPRETDTDDHFAVLCKETGQPSELSFDGSSVDNISNGFGNRNSSPDHKSVSINDVVKSSANNLSDLNSSHSNGASGDSGKQTYAKELSELTKTESNPWKLDSIGDSTNHANEVDYTTWRSLDPNSDSVVKGKRSELQSQGQMSAAAQFQQEETLISRETDCANIANKYPANGAVTGRSIAEKSAVLCEPITTLPSSRIASGHSPIGNSDMPRITSFDVKDKQKREGQFTGSASDKRRVPTASELAIISSNNRPQTNSTSSRRQIISRSSDRRNDAATNGWKNHLTTIALQDAERIRQFEEAYENMGPREEKVYVRTMLPSRGGTLRSVDKLVPADSEEARNGMVVQMADPAERAEREAALHATLKERNALENAPKELAEKTIDHSTFDILQFKEGDREARERDAAQKAISTKTSNLKANDKSSSSATIPQFPLKDPSLNADEPPSLELNDFDKKIGRTSQQKRIYVERWHAERSREVEKRQDEEKSAKRKSTLNSKGKLMLMNMGWNEGSGLGVRQQGNPLPVRLQAQTDRSGLGATGNDMAERTNAPAYDQPFPDTAALTAYGRPGRMSLRHNRVEFVYAQKKTDNTTDPKESST